MLQLDLSADDLVRGLLGRAAEDDVCILDSCGVGTLGSHLIFAGLHPVETLEFDGPPNEALKELESRVGGDKAVIFTLSYELGNHLQNVPSRHAGSAEPLVFMSVFDTIAIHDHTRGATTVAGREAAGFADAVRSADFNPRPITSAAEYRSDRTRREYVDSIEAIKERIRSGDTYQTNLTRRIEVEMPEGLTAESVFWRLRRDNPAPFAAFIKRVDSTVISASPERFFKVENGIISASPIKGTEARGATAAEDAMLRNSLLASQKDRAENTMIVDLLRNDLGRICEFGSVEVKDLCRIEEHPSLFHLVSTIEGRLRAGIGLRDMLLSLYPCGSITGAPKISTMRIIDEAEGSPRGLSMGAVGYWLPSSFGLGERLDLSVAIRTAVVRGRSAVFNVGGGIVIDSDPDTEWDETVVKSRALLEAFGADIRELSGGHGV
ncbi:MAG: anthranilate synthase component I family protein [Pyrinomonadaceae bacterium]